MNVGRIIITSNKPAWTQSLGDRLNDWLNHEKWSHAVSVVKNSKPRRKGEALKVRIVFEPGEYQSNGRRRFDFALLPNFEVLERRLKTWLFEVE